MSQRIAGCCCGKCVNAALGVCCIKLPPSTANCLGDCEGFDPQTSLSVGTINNLTNAQCTQAGIDYGLNTVFTVYPNCSPITICDCIESVTECVCANQNGIWNGSNSCATGCLGACCIFDLNRIKINCFNLMSECDCDNKKTPLNNVVWSVGVDCQSTPCKDPPTGCTLWKSEFLRTTRYISYGNSYPTPSNPCRCQDQSALGKPVQSGNSYLHETYYFTAAPYPNGIDYTMFNKLTDDHIYDSTNSGCLDELHFFEQTTYTKIRDICDQPQNSCNIDRLVYRTTSENTHCLEPSCVLNCVNTGTSSSTITQQSDRTGDFHDCCNRLYNCANP